MMYAIFAFLAGAVVGVAVGTTWCRDAAQRDEFARRRDRVMRPAWPPVSREWSR